MKSFRQLEMDHIPRSSEAYQVETATKNQIAPKMFRNKQNPFNLTIKMPIYFDVFPTFLFIKRKTGTSDVKSREHIRSRVNELIPH